MSKVLIIEDDELMVRMLVRLLNKLELEAITSELVPTDEQLKEACLVISDISLPNVPGIAHIEKIAKSTCCNKLPVIVISGMDITTLESTQTLLKLLNVNLLGTFRKPFNKKQLSDFIKESIIETVVK
ncbi:response regulator [Motilimonas eburnea]|uniref:response regulator n=1 Tax=Motilimonas eburnea TaxID=1737488 RepID=UPI001E5E29B9|nr:response regulator [Motilimonas eburnea]MCE2573002.1 response regulator [Motilimonas eburnea]